MWRDDLFATPGQIFIMMIPLRGLAYGLKSAGNHVPSSHPPVIAYAESASPPFLTRMSGPTLQAASLASTLPHNCNQVLLPSSVLYLPFSLLPSVSESLPRLDPCGRDGTR